MNTTIALSVLFLLLLALFGWMIRTELRLRKFWRGKNGANLEEIFGALAEKMKDLSEKSSGHERALEKISGQIKQSVRGVSMIRFNPFKDSGSNQSFSVALMNDEGDGIVISSMYARDRISVFGKPIENGRAAQELTEEEKEVLKTAREKIS